MSFKEKYKNYESIKYLENNQVEKYISQYLNDKTKYTILYALNSFFVENEKDGISIDEFLKLSPVQARDRIWEVATRYVKKGNERTASMLKTYATLLYQNANEEKGLTLNWKRHHKIRVNTVREGVTPTHEQVYRLIDISTHLDTKAMIALSYSSGLKGQGIIGLKVKTLRDAIEERERIREEFKTLLKDTEDPEKREKIKTVLEELPLFLRITPDIYGKRFTDDSKSFYPAMVCKDAELLLMKYYEKHKRDSDGNEPLFTTRVNNAYDQSYLSIKLKSALKKYYEVNKQLGNTQPSLIRRSFYNRLVSHNMKDLFREFLMGHSLKVKKHYFNWDSQKLDILFEYLNCNFNKKNGNYGERIDSVSKDLEKKENEISELKKQLEYFQSNDFVDSVVDRVKGKNPFDIIQESNNDDVMSVKIPITKGEELAKLLNNGFSLTASDNKYFYLEKDL